MDPAVSQFTQDLELTQSLSGSPKATRRQPKAAALHTRGSSDFCSDYNDDGTCDYNRDINKDKSKKTSKNISHLNTKNASSNHMTSIPGGTAYTLGLRVKSGW